MDSHENLDLTFSPRSIRVFISHSHVQKEIAARISYSLENYFGLEVFIAHDDIEPTRIWEDKILEELTATDVVLALLTEEFKNSKFCDQEIGFAIAAKKFIIPIKINLIPYGFIGKYQAMPYKVATDEWHYWIDLCKTIITLIEQQEQFTNKTTDLIIKALRGSSGFDIANKISKLIRNISSLNNLQVNEIFKAFSDNIQVSGAFEIQYLMKELIKKYGSVIDQELLKRYGEISDSTV